MGQLSRRRGNSDLQRLLDALDHREDIASIVQLTTCAITETSSFHQAMTEQVADTLNQLEEDVTVARWEGRMSPHREQAITHRIQAYLHEMLSIMQETDQAVYRLMVNQVTAKRDRLRGRR